MGHTTPLPFGLTPQQQTYQAQMAAMAAFSQTQMSPYFMSYMAGQNQSMAATRASPKIQLQVGAGRNVVIEMF